MNNLIRFPQKGQQNPPSVMRQIKQAEVYELTLYKQQLLEIKEELARMKRRMMKLISQNETPWPGSPD